jgi:hypothetical protein
LQIPAPLTAGQLQFINVSWRFFAAMTCSRIVAAPALTALVLCAAEPAVAAPADALVVTQLADPDPGFVAPKPEKRQPHAARKVDDENPTLEQAMENLGRVTGALAQKMGSQYRPSDADLKAAQERLRQRLQESNDRLNAAREQARPSGN